MQKTILDPEFAWTMSHFENGMKFTQQHHSDLNKHRQKRWVIVCKNNCNWSYRMICTAFWPKGKIYIRYTKSSQKYKRAWITNDTTFKRFLGSRNQMKMLVWWKKVNFSLKGHIKVICVCADHRVVSHHQKSDFFSLRFVS